MKRETGHRVIFAAACFCMAVGVIIIYGGILESARGKSAAAMAVSGLVAVPSGDGSSSLIPVPSLDTTQSASPTQTHAGENTDPVVTDGTALQTLNINIVSPIIGTAISTDKFTFKAKSENATKVYFYYKELNGTTWKILGAATSPSGSSEWSYLVNIRENVPDGSYVAVAKAYNSRLASWSHSQEVGFKVDLKEEVPAAVLPPPNTEIANQQQSSPVAEPARTEQALQSDAQGSSDVSSPDPVDPVGSTDAKDTEKLPVVEVVKGKRETTVEAGPGGQSVPKRIQPRPQDNKKYTKDTDGDGLSDADEERYGSDPKNPDTDRDGFLDGDEVRNGFDPLKPSRGEGSDRMMFQSPKESGLVDNKYKVDDIKLIKEGEEEDKDAKLKLTGRALPNAFVTVYIFSDPIIVTVKADKDGNWSYELDKELEDGGHEAYVAITDNTGRITSKSEPLAFVKTAEAVTVVPSVQAREINSSLAPLERSKTSFFSAALLIIIIFLGIALTIIGMVVRNYQTDEENTGKRHSLY